MTDRYETPTVVATRLGLLWDKAGGYYLSWDHLLEPAVAAYWANRDRVLAEQDAA